MVEQSATGGSTVIETVSVADAAALLSVTIREKTSVAAGSAGASVGAVKVGCAAEASDRVTEAPESCVQA
jgi:hypothetical protein